ncbi:unnamed protein product [Acanthoscelides obtectus]|uniref:Teneurin-1-4-like galactose-binding domain-containing protein n=1 Tax=Acanthoscelides obtectus TaxID=200917 RepID=A0A9P0JZV8_ACAOB|nr:unnamed protein product [Acanthoscelides obtectus]CAK1649342.1 Teneurin-a [Acanthoscelides obtectus]
MGHPPPSPSQQQQQQAPPGGFPGNPPVLEQRELDIPHTATIPPYQFWNSEFRNKQPAFIRFNFTVPWGANFAVYGRRNVAPSVTQYDFAEFIKGGRVDHRLRRKKRGAMEDDLDDLPFQNHFKLSYGSRRDSDVLDAISSGYEGARKILADAEPPREPFYVQPISLQDRLSPPGTDLPRPAAYSGLEPDLGHVIERRSVDGEHVMGKWYLDASHTIGKREAEMEPMLVNVSILQYLDTGRWFLSVYNDELQPHAVSLVISEAEGVSTTCPNDCSGRGSCYLGKCDCIDGFQGIDCSKSKSTSYYVIILNNFYWWRQVST